MINSIENLMEGKEGEDALFLYATEGILIVNEKGIIIRANPSTERLFGYEKGELIGEKIEILVPKRLSDNHSKHHENYIQNPHARSMGAGVNLFGLRKDGSEFPVEISLSPYESSNGKFVIAFIIDITLRSFAEKNLKNYSTELERQVKNRTLILEEAVEELEKTKGELKLALEKEKGLNSLKSRCVSMASHEFRTPLTTMLSSLSLVTKYGEQNDKENQGKHVGKIKRSIQNLTDILNDLLSVSKLEEGKIENFPAELDLRNFIKDICIEMQTLAVNNQKINDEYSGKEHVSLDKKILKNILFNLISNAIKFTTEGGLIEIKTIVSEMDIKISVHDNGIGISKDDQKHLFERFFRGHNAAHIQGTGLGLNIVAKYAGIMNGYIDSNSEINKGTTFTLIINNHEENSIDRGQ